ncbi:DMT family transporter [Candidatus Dojkabacteria bacterium]|nr:DMT family transporter [Candidatus Dojkabacteria bacterium]
MSYTLLSFFAAVFFALSLVVNKFISKHKIEDKNSLVFLFMLASFTFSFVLFPFTTKAFPNINTLWNIFIASSTFIIGYYLFFFGIQDTDASIFAPLFQLQAAIVAVLAYLFLRERFQWTSYLWIFVTILGVVLVSIDEKTSFNSFFKKGILFILAMQLLHAISNLFVGFSLKGVGFIDMLFWEYIILGIYSLVFYAAIRPTIKYPAKSIFYFGVATYLSSIGALFLFKAFEQNLTVSATISLMAAPVVFIITVVASRFRPELLEHHSTRIYEIRAIGLVLLLFGAIQLAQR